MSETQLDMFQKELDQIKDTEDLKKILQQMSDRMQGMEKSIAELTQLVKNVDFFKKISDKISDLEKPKIPHLPGVYPYPNFPSYPNPLGPHLKEYSSIPGFGYRGGSPIFTASMDKLPTGVVKRGDLAQYTVGGATLKLKVDPND